MVLEPIVFIDEAPLPKVLVVVVPVARVVLPDEVRVVKAPVEGVEAPIVVLFIDPPVMVAPEDAKVLAVKVPDATETLPEK